MENKENLATEEVAENVKQTTEQTPKLYTEDELNAKVNEVLGKKMPRQEAKIRKKVENEYREYKDLVETLELGTGRKGAKELNDVFRAHYEKNGVTFESKKAEPVYSARELEVLGKAEAEEIIDAGYDEVVEEVDRLSKLGANMSAKDKVIFKRLAEYRQSSERGKELAKIGVSKEEYDSDEFKRFASKFKSDTPITEVYETYQKTLPKKEFKTTGSMKTTQTNDNGVKEYYTPEEAKRFTQKELDANPQIFHNIKKSMGKWKK